MSERILEALMRLFAIVARIDDAEKESGNEVHGRTMVQAFLKERLPQKLTEDYLRLFDQFVEQHRKPGKKGSAKRLSLNSVKVLAICTQINKELSHRQKIIVLFRLLEFVYTNERVEEQEMDFVDTVASTFNIESIEYQLMKSFISGEEEDLADSSDVLYITGNPHEDSFARHYYSEGLDGIIKILRITTANLLILKYSGSLSIQINGQVIGISRINIFNQGSSIRNPKIQPIYYSDIVSTFLSDESVSKISFKAKDLSYTFKRGNIGLHPLDIVEEGGKLMGIMGASGSGKSTLLNLLNGNLKPTKGKVTINGIDIHQQADQIEGVIGYVAQDDLLIEELSVFENLYYNAKLCFGQQDDDKIKELTDKMLLTLGLADSRDLKVGNPLEKTISGGQRKRLNIALELIREPSVLFVDEPTSGLSSRDSENIMDLLKELALKGKLVFAVIHQPSSDIFKMFDKLIIMDTGGYPIYYGNPVDSIIYFKKLVNHINSNESECPSCGNVNPEQIFNIIESKVVDEYGNQTQEKKIPPSEWYSYYRDIIGNKIMDIKNSEETPKSTFSIPGVLKQFRVFFTRDILSKISNRQYILINLLEAPALALLLAFFMKFFLHEDKGGSGYIFRENENIPAYLFISVIVALFIGLTVSSEEIIKDRRIRKRESFLNLSRNSYLFSKIAIMFGLSAIQMGLFVLVGSYILDLENMAMVHWLVLFSVCCFANMLGLNISSAFNSAKVIYILIPILIIPQLLFSGILVKFDKLNPMFASQSGVPWIGNIMASRWAYEALAVSQFKWNSYEKEFYEFDKRKKFANWKKDYWVTELRNKLNEALRLQNSNEDPERLEDIVHLVKNEINRENNFLKGISFSEIDNLTAENLDEEKVKEITSYLNQVTEHYKKVFLKAEQEKEKKIQSMINSPEENAKYLSLLNKHKNDNLERFATNRNDLNFIIEYDGQLIQKKDLIYLEPYHAGFFDAHFYAPSKKLFNYFIDTYYANLLVLWGMTIALGILLFADGLAKTINGVSGIQDILQKKRES